MALQNTPSAFSVDLKRREKRLLSVALVFAELKGQLTRQGEVNVADVTMQERTVPTYEVTTNPTAATSRKTRSDLNIFYSWLQARSGNDGRRIEAITPEELDPILMEMYGTLRAKHGAEYDPKSLKSIRNSIERHLRDHSYPVSTIYSTIFRKSQEAYKKRTGELMNEQVLSQDELVTVRDIVFCEDYLQSKNLITCLLWMTAFHFPDSLKTKNDHLSLLWGDLELKKDQMGVECLALTVAASSRKPGRTLVTPSFYRVYADAENPRYCFINLYKFYASHRPRDRLDDKSRFYLQPAGHKSFFREGLTLRFVSSTFKYLKQLAVPVPPIDTTEIISDKANDSVPE